MGKLFGERLKDARKAKRIQVGGTVLDKESVIIMGRVKGVYQK
jgi:hypothetical protein